MLHPNSGRGLNVAEKKATGWGELIGAYTAMVMMVLFTVILVTYFLGYIEGRQAGIFCFASPFIGLAISLMIIERRMNHV